MIPTPDLAALYNAADGLTVTAACGVDSTQVHFRQPTVEIMGGERLDRDYTMRYRTSTLVALTRGSAVVIGGNTYTVNAIPEFTGSGDERVARLSRNP